MLLALLFTGLGIAEKAEKPEKIPVALGSWKGPSAGSFKGALRRGLAKDCTFTKPKTARAIIDGEVTQEGKKFTVRVIVKAAQSGEVLEQREYPYSKPSLSQGQTNKLGREVAEMVRRAPASP
jgi:hypothetical protein